MGIVRSFLDRFFGPPSEDKFAKMFSAMLQRMGDPRTCLYDKSAFRLVFSENGEQSAVINLRNMYSEYCNCEQARRKEWLLKTCQGFIHPMEIPDEFEDARHDLLPTVRTRSMLEVLRLDTLLAGGTPTELAWLPLTEHLVICLVYDLPNSMQFVNQEHLDQWGITLYEALEVALQNLTERSHSMYSLGDSVFIIQNGDSYDGTRLLLKDRISQLELAGSPVAMPLNREMLVITGSEDVEGLGIMATIADDQAGEARPLCPIPLILNNHEWETWFPPEGHPHYGKFRLLELQYLYGEYAEQKELLEKRNEQTGTDVFVATFAAMEEHGEAFSWAIWIKGCTTWLPQTQKVALSDPETNQTTVAPWERVWEVAGHRMKKLDLYPPRWLLDDFPTPDELERIGGATMTQE